MFLYRKSNIDLESLYNDNNTQVIFLYLRAAFSKQTKSTQQHNYIYISADMHILWPIILPKASVMNSD